MDPEEEEEEEVERLEERGWLISDNTFFWKIPSKQRGSSFDLLSLVSCLRSLYTRTCIRQISLPSAPADTYEQARPLPSAGWLVARRRRGARAEAEAEEASMRRRRRRIRRRPLPPLPRCRPPTSTSFSSTTRGCSGWSWRACCASAAIKVRRVDAGTKKEKGIRKVSLATCPAGRSSGLRKKGQR